MRQICVLLIHQYLHLAPHIGLINRKYVMVPNILPMPINLLCDPYECDILDILHKSSVLTLAIQSYFFSMSRNFPNVQLTSSASSFVVTATVTATPPVLLTLIVNFWLHICFSCPYVNIWIFEFLTGCACLRACVNWPYSLARVITQHQLTVCVCIAWLRIVTREYNSHICVCVF